MDPQNPSQQNQSNGNGDKVPQPGFQTTVADTTLSEALVVLRKRRWVLVCCVLLGTLYGLYESWTQPRLYTATGSIQVRPGASAQYRVDNAAALGGLDAQTRLPTEVAILLSNSVAVSVIRSLNLQNNPDFLGIKGPVPHHNLEDNNGAVRERAVRTLHKNIKIGQTTHTDIITISYSCLSNDLAMKIVNEVINTYIERSFQTRFASTQRVSEWLSGQLDDLKQEVETSQEQLMELQKHLGVLGFDASHNQITTELDDLTRSADEARIQRIIAEAKYRILSSGDSGLSIGNDPNSAMNISLLNTLRTQRSTTQTQLAQNTVEYGANHPIVRQLKAELVELDRQIDIEQSRLLVQAKQQYNAALSNEKMTNDALEGQKSDAYKLRDDLVQYTIKQREFESNRTLYEGLLQRLRAAGVQAGLESSEIDIVDSAMMPTSPNITPKSTLILAAMAVGLLAGVLLAFVLESLDTGLRSIAEIEAITELPSLAIIPRSRRISSETAEKLTVAQRNISVLTQPKSHFAESFRSLRTSLLLSTAGHPPKLIVVTSATPSEGKTTTATNLAAVLAQRDTRVLLIDSDLRRPTVHHRFGITGKTGLTTILTGTSTLDEAIHRIPEIPNLDILPSGPVPPFPTEMLSSETMTALLHRVAGLYDHIVLDSPPILSVTDGVILARQADAVALVVRHGKSSKHVVRRARDLLVRSGAPVTGIVLNAVDLSSPEYYGYYGYYGYTYYGVDASGWESQNGPGKKEEKPL
jgi:succinoglycan biosynthesis transport protein ExoP